MNNLMNTIRNSIKENNFEKARKEWLNE